MYKRVIAILLAVFVAVAGLVAPASATTEEKTPAPVLTFTADVDRHGDLDVAVTETGLKPKAEAKFFGVAKFYAKYACIKPVYKKYVKKYVKHGKVYKKVYKKWYKKVRIESDWGKAYDWAEATADDKGTATAELELDLDVDCDHKRSYKKLLFVKWSHLFVKDKVSGAHDFEYGPWYKKFWFGHHGHHGYYGHR